MSGVSSEELLIECVREYPFLYDASDAGYHDNNKKENAWKQISENFNEWTATDCKKKWIALRDSFRKAYRKRKTTKSGDPAKQIRPWKFESVMSFIIPHIAERTQISNLTVDEGTNVDTDTENPEKDDDTLDINKDQEVALKEGQEVNDAVEDATKCKLAHKSGRMVKNSVVPTNSPPQVAQVLQDYLKTKKNKTEESSVTSDDALCYFFKAMEKTVRNFNLPLQIEIKGKISNLVNEFELRNYNMQTTSTSTSSYDFQRPISASSTSCSVPLSPSPNYNNTYRQEYFPPIAQQPLISPNGPLSLPTSQLHNMDTPWGTE